MYIWVKNSLSFCHNIQLFLAAVIVFFSLPNNFFKSLELKVGGGVGIYIPNPSIWEDWGVLRVGGQPELASES